MTNPPSPNGIAQIGSMGPARAVMPPPGLPIPALPGLAAIDSAASRSQVCRTVQNALNSARIQTQPELCLNHAHYVPDHALGGH